MLDSLDTLIAFVLIMLIVSLLITIVVQMVSAALNLRGRNLATGLAETLGTISPGLAAQNKALATYVLTGPMISDSSISWGPEVWHLATAVRPDEVFDAIHRIATGQRAAPADLREAARSLLVGLGIDPAVIHTVAGEEGEVAASVHALQQAVANLPKEQSRQAQTALDSVCGRLNALANRADDQARAAAVTAAQPIDQAYQKFEYWFEITQDRVQQWFTAHTRFVTIIFAFIFSAWLQLDTVEIFKLVSGNRTVRDQLVAQADLISGQATKLVGDSQSVLQEAFGSWSKTQDQALRGGLARITVDPSDNRATVRSKIGAALVDTPAKDKLLTDFDTAVDAVATQRLNKLAADFHTEKMGLDQTGFELFLNGKSRWGKNWTDKLGDHLWGMLFSAGLLSLGAPFWYNVLKGLSSLRSVVAQNISDERKQDQLPTSNSPSDPPPSIRSPS